MANLDRLEIFSSQISSVFFNPNGNAAGFESQDLGYGAVGGRLVTVLGAPTLTSTDFIVD
jgi:hypothetical protein